MRIIVKDIQELNNFALEFAKKLQGNELIGLSGELGAGKTVLTKLIAKALGVKEEILSPTFNIIKIYKSKLGNLYHIDAYRLETIGYDPVLDDYLFDENSLRFVEWYEFLNEAIFDEAIKINIIINFDGSRTLDISGGLYV